MSVRSLHQLPAPPSPRSGGATPTLKTQALERDLFGREIDTSQSRTSYGDSTDREEMFDSPQKTKKKESATDVLGRRAGSLADEIDFPAFVASLVHGTFDAIVNSSIKQMEAYADLVSAVAKPLDQFARENVTDNQARDWLVKQYPLDVGFANENGAMQLAPIGQNEDGEADAPSWLKDFGYDGEELSSEFLEETILPKVRERVAQDRLSALATMVLMGMQRVVVKDGTIAARLRFRAAAADHAAVQYATGNDPSSGPTEWGRRGSERQAVMKVSTVDVNVQSDTELEAKVYGDVKINFASETVPLDRFVSEMQRTLLERHAKRLHPPQQSRSTGANAPSPAQAIVQPSAPSIRQSPELTPEVAEVQPVRAGGQGGGA